MESNTCASPLLLVSNWLLSVCLSVMIFSLLRFSPEWNGFQRNGWPRLNTGLHGFLHKKRSVERESWWASQPCYGNLAQCRCFHHENLSYSFLPPLHSLQPGVVQDHDCNVGRIHSKASPHTHSRSSTCSHSALAWLLRLNQTSTREITQARWASTSSRSCSRLWTDGSRTSWCSTRTGAERWNLTRWARRSTAWVSRRRLYRFG